jgi:hypothetical protein
MATGSAAGVSAAARRVESAKLAALFEAEEKPAAARNPYCGGFLRALKSLLAAGVADPDVRIGHMTPLLMVRGLMPRVVRACLGLPP